MSEPKERTGAVKAADQPTAKWYDGKFTSTNFLASIFMIVLAGFGAKVGGAQGFAAAVLSVLGTLHGVRVLVQNNKFSFVKAFGDTNWWASIGTVLLTFVPTAPPELLPAIEDTANAVLARNWPLAASAGLYLLNVIFKLVRK